jgi:hypothetical protein
MNAADGSTLHHVLADCLGRSAIVLPKTLPRAERCIATVVSPGFEGLLDDMLASLHANGGCPDALVAVFSVRESHEIRRIAAKHGAVLFRCRPQARIDATVKSVLYTVARAVEAERFVCLDADMLVLGSLGPLFAALEVCPEGTILACRERCGWFRDLADALCCGYLYGGEESDIQRLLGRQNGEGGYPFVVNDGLFAGNRSALLALDGCIRGMPGVLAWVDERHEIRIRNQFIFNLALAHLSCGVELDPAYNVQLHAEHVDTGVEGGRARAWCAGREARVLHFNGWGRSRHPEYRSLFVPAGG